jgi:thioesterase domain-containing protein
VLIGYPDWRETIAAKADFAAIVTEAQRQILSQCGDGPIRLAGHSFGGFVAFTTAHQLVELGRRVTFLGLLDTRRWSSPAVALPATPAESFRLIGKIGEIFKRGDVGDNLRRIFRVFLEFRAFVMLDGFARCYMSVAGRRGRANAHAQLLYALRSYALRDGGRNPSPFAPSSSARKRVLRRTCRMIADGKRCARPFGSCRSTVTMFL